MKDMFEHHPKDVEEQWPQSLRYMRCCICCGSNTMVLWSFNPTFPDNPSGSKPFEWFSSLRSNAGSSELIATSGKVVKQRGPVN